jgi:hypothetical protein
VNDVTARGRISYQNEELMGKESAPRNGAMMLSA